MVKHTARATCRLTAFGEAVLTFPYSAPMVDDLKAAIPYRFRDWDPAHKVWTIEPAYADLAIQILLQYFPAAETPRRSRSQARGQGRSAGNGHFRVLHLRETAPIELIEASYRDLARLHHPDAGGTHEAMQAINTAYVQLKERVGA
jgi:hypothetical protein